MAYLANSIFTWLQGSTRSQSLAVNKADIPHWYKVLNNAENYEEWKKAAERLDELEGNNDWKRLRSSPLFDHTRLAERIRKMHEKEAEDKMEGLVFWLRSGLVRNLGGIGNHQLYDQCHIGTKSIIEQHNEGLRRLVERVADCPAPLLSYERRLAFFTESRHALGKTALLLSGGAKLGMFHLGIIKALSEQSLLPRIIAGSSAGAIIAAVVGVCTEEELAILTTDGLPGFFSAFAKQFIGSMMNTKLRRIITTGHMMEVKRLQQALKDLIGDFTFHEAHERTGRIINITVSPENAFEKPRLLNYLTAPDVLLWSAATASCAFTDDHAESQLWVKSSDGSLQPYSLRYQQNGTWEALQLRTELSMHTDLPMNRLQELFNVNFFVVSQTNPHAIPFLQKFQKHGKQAIQSKPGMIGRLFNSMSYMVKSEVLHRCKQAITLGLAPRLLQLTLDQKYVGDVTIVPPFSLEQYRKIFNDPTWESCEYYVKQGERCTWAQMSQIRGQCQMEYVLDDCVRKVAAKLLAEQQQRQAEEEESLRMQSESLSGPQCSSTSGESVPSGSPCNAVRPSQPVSSTFNSSFRQQRHTHLDLNEFFTKNQDKPIKKLGHTGNLGAITSFTSADGDIEDALNSPEGPSTPHDASIGPASRVPPLDKNHKSSTADANLPSHANGDVAPSRHEVSSLDSRFADSAEQGHGDVSPVLVSRKGWSLRQGGGA